MGAQADARKRFVNEFHEEEPTLSTCPGTYYLVLYGGLVKNDLLENLLRMLLLYETYGLA